MERRYRLIASPDLLQIDYNQLADDNMDSTRYSIDGQWAIIEYKTDIEIDESIEIWDNDQAVDFLMSNYDEWDKDSLAEQQ